MGVEPRGEHGCSLRGFSSRFRAKLQAGNARRVAVSKNDKSEAGRSLGGDPLVTQPSADRKNWMPLLHGER